jgi:hypothetical protein
VAKQRHPNKYWTKSFLANAYRSTETICTSGVDSNVSFPYLGCPTGLSIKRKRNDSFSASAKHRTINQDRLQLASKGCQLASKGCQLASKICHFSSAGYKRPSISRASKMCIQYCRGDERSQLSRYLRCDTASQYRLHVSIQRSA